MAVRATVVTPISGPLAGYGRDTATALKLWAKRFTGPDQVRLEVVDAHPDASEAARRAASTSPDLVFGPYGSRPARDVAAATSRLVWNHGGARIPTRDNVVSVLSPARDYFRGAIELTRTAHPRPHRVGVLHANTGFSRNVAAGATDTAVHYGLRVERAAFPALPPKADVLLVAGQFADESRLARELPRHGWHAVGFVGAGVEDVLAELGSDREGLVGPAQWMPNTAPEPQEGPPAAEFVAAYRARTGKEPSYPAAQAFAAGVIALRCLREASAARDSELLTVARRLDLNTLFGRFRLDEDGRQVGHQVLTVQWQEGARSVVWPREQAESAFRYPLSW